MTHAAADKPRAAVVLGLCAVFLAPTLAYRLGVDQGVFAYMGGALLDGRWPYAGTWESDFPGLIFIQAAEILVFGKSVAMFRLFDVIWQLANVYLIFRIASRISGRPAGLVAAALYCLVYQGYGPWNTAQREGFALWFVLAGFWAWFTADRRPAWVTAAFIGLGLGIAVTIKPTILAMSLFYLPLATSLRDRRAWVTAVVGAAALSAPAAVLIAGYWAAGELRQMYEACIAYQAIYTARLRGDEPLLAFWIGKLARLGRNAIAVPVVYAPFLLARAWRRERLMIWMGLLGAIYGVFVQGTFAGYHYLPGLALGAILVGDLFARFASWLSARLDSDGPIARLSRPRTLAYLVVATLAVVYLRHAPFRDLATLHFLDAPRPGEFRNRTIFDFTESYELAEYLRARTAPGEPVQIWGYESLTYYLADRPAASRFQMTHPLVMRVPGEDLTPMQQRWRAEFIGDVERRKPAFVAVVRQDNWWWAPEERTSEELLDDFPEWKNLIARDYALDTTIGRFLVYRRVAGARP